MQKSTSSPITVGLDIGYGVVKGVTDLGVITFPSVCGHALELTFQADETAKKYPGDQITDDEGSWFVGELALSQVPPAQLLMLRGRTAKESAWGNVFRTRFAKVALGKLLPDKRNGEVVHIRIATGLPVKHMRDAADLKLALIGKHLVTTDSTQFVANITDVMIMPQPYGTIYANMLTTSGDINECHAYQRTAVCDVGTYSVDLAVDQDGEYIEAESGGIGSGVYTAQQRIAVALERDFRSSFSYKDIDNVLRTKCIRVRGKTIDYTQEVEQAYESLRTATVSLINEKWQDAARLDVIYISGGGAEVVYPYVKAVYDQAQLVPQSQLANARGYLNFAKFSAK